jgi:hypothetical protein
MLIPFNPGAVVTFGPPSDLFNQALTSNSSAGQATLRTNLLASAISGSGSQIRVTMAAPSTIGTTIQSVHIGTGKASADVYDFVGDQVALTFGGSSSVTIATNSTATSDWANFSVDDTLPLVVSWYLPSAGNDRRRGGFANVSTYFKAGADDASTENATGYTIAGGLLITLTKIEVR